MIRSLLSICLIFLCSVVYAQQDGDASHSIAIKAYNYSSLPKMLNQSENRRYISTGFNSLMVKFNNNLYSYRLSGSYYDKSIEFSNNCDNCGLAAGKVKDYTFKAGFEKNFNYGPVQPYIGFDMGYRSNEFNGRINTADPQSLVAGARKRGFTLSPLLGVKFSPVKLISLFAEGNAEYFYAWGKETTNLPGNSEGGNSHKFNKGEYLYNPISVGIQIHLTRQK
jgi:hypothetical protein